MARCLSLIVPFADLRTLFLRHAGIRQPELQEEGARTFTAAFPLGHLLVFMPNPRKHVVVFGVWAAQMPTDTGIRTGPSPLYLSSFLESGAANMPTVIGIVRDRGVIP